MSDAPYRQRHIIRFVVCGIDGSLVTRVDMASPRDIRW